jgi:DNA-3-methyladenine glycosylase
MLTPQHSRVIAHFMRTHHQPPLPRSFYARPTLDVARDLLGKTLWRASDARCSAGVIVETEAYISAIDPAAHGYRGKTSRNATMFGPPGHLYVYFTYGMHYCMNVVTETDGQAAAVLLRAVEPLHGIDLMRARRRPTIPDRDLCRGPARLCQAFAVDRTLDGADLTGPELWITETPGFSPDTPTATSPRIGITQAADWPWRFYLPGNRFVSGRPV